MKGTWGRRIVGWVQYRDGAAWFHLEMNTSSGHHAVNALLAEYQLAATPGLYAKTLDYLTLCLEKKVGKTALKVQNTSHT